MTVTTPTHNSPRTINERYYDAFGEQGGERGGSSERVDRRAHLFGPMIMRDGDSSIFLLLQLLVSAHFCLVFFRAVVLFFLHIVSRFVVFYEEMRG